MNKEYWLYCFEPTNMLFAFKEIQQIKRQHPENFKEIHVIEYQALLDEAEAHKKTAAALQGEIEKLQKQNEKLKTALNVYALTNDTFPEYGDVARQTLKEIDG